MWLQRLNARSRSTGFSLAAACFFLLAGSACKKEEPRERQPITYISDTVVISLAGQQWILYQYAFENDPYTLMNDTIGFVTDSVCMWNGIDYGYSCSRYAGHPRARWLNFYDSPYGKLDMLFPYDTGYVYPQNICCRFRAEVDNTTRHLCFRR